MPLGFHRRNGTFGMAEIGAPITFIFEQHPVLPGNNDGINNFVLDPTSPNFSTPNTASRSVHFVVDFLTILMQFCAIYNAFANVTVRSLYPNPTGELRKALNENLATFFSPLSQPVGACEQVFPFGQD